MLPLPYSGQPIEPIETMRQRLSLKTAADMQIKVERALPDAPASLHGGMISTDDRMVGQLPIEGFTKRNQ